MIPTLDIRRHAAEKNDTGELKFDFELEEDLVDIPYVSMESPIFADLFYEIFEDDKVEIHGKVVYTLKGLCSRCLRETSQKVEGEARGLFCPGKGEEDYSYSNYKIDLKEFLRDAVLFSIPNGLYCSEDCSVPDYKT